MRSPEVPPGAEIIKTFAAYRQLVDAFFQSAFNLLIIVGDPGLSKSKEFQLHNKAVEAYRIKGHATPFYTYKELWWHRNQLVVIDDGELLWKEKDGRILLRSLTETEIAKEIFWASANKDLEKAKIPTRFLTHSKVAVICNKFVFGKSEEYAAILDRANIVYFAPTPLEVHTNTAIWFWDQEVHDYIGSRLNMIDNLTARTYVKAAERKVAGMDWQKLIDEVYCHDFALALVQSLEMSSQPKRQRINAFKTQTGMSQATYYNYATLLAKQGQLCLGPPQRITVQGEKPDETIDTEVNPSH